MDAGITITPQQQQCSKWTDVKAEQQPAVALSQNETAAAATIGSSGIWGELKCVGGQVLVQTLADLGGRWHL